MFEDNILMRVCAGLGLIVSLIFIICSFIPALEFEKELPAREGAVIRIVAMIMVIGFIRGAF
jgi:hypothetical protein